MTRPIGYYVHYHGDGHRQRALAIAAWDPDRMVLLGTGLAGRSGKVAAIDLPDDRMPQTHAFDGADGTLSRPQALHYAPLDHDGIRTRVARIAQWIAEARPALMVVDVSVEVALLARLCATPVAFMRLSGRRDDQPHLEAYRAASLLIAPFAAALDDNTLPDWIRAKTVYCPGIAAPPPRLTAAADSVLVVAGRGGAAFDGTRIASAAAATPNYRWRVIGPAVVPNQCPSNLTFSGWVEDAPGAIAAAGIVIGAAGDGLVNTVIAAKRPFICCPEPRPFDEQVQKALALQSRGAAVVIDAWPPAQAWPTLLAQAAQIDLQRLTALGDTDGAARTWRLLADFADCQK